MNNIDWNNAPITATHYGGGKFWRMHGSGNYWETKCAFQWVFSNESPMAFIDYCERPQTQPKPKYEYGIEYPTNGKKPDLPDDVLVEFRSREHGQWNQYGAMPLKRFRWENSSAFRIVDERYKPKPPVITQEQTNGRDESDDIWEKSPVKASCYGGGRYWMFCENYNQWLYWDGRRWEANWIGDLPMRCADYSVRPQPKQPAITQDEPNKYSRQIVGLDGETCQIDVYRVLAAFEVDSHPVAHAIKKLLAPGMRHAKPREQDLREAIASIEAELLMMEQGK